MTTTPNTRKAVVLEVELFLPDEAVEHIEQCGNPLYCASSFGNLATEVVTINLIELDEEGDPMPFTLNGLLHRVRVNDLDWINATRDSETKPPPTFTKDETDDAA